MKNRDGQKLLFTREVATMFNVSMTTVRSWIKSKKIIATKGHNGRMYILKKSLDHMLASTSLEITLARSKEEVINKMLFHNLGVEEKELVLRELEIKRVDTYKLTVAIKKFQTINGLNPNGILDSATISFMETKVHKPKKYSRNRLSFISYPSTYKSSKKRNISKIIIFDSKTFELDESFYHHVLGNTSVHYIIDYFGKVINTLPVEEISTMIKAKGRENAILIELVNPFDLSKSVVFNIENHSYVNTVVPESVATERSNISHSEAQKKSLMILLEMLSMKHNIPKSFPLNDKLEFYNRSSPYFHRLFSGVCMSYNVFSTACDAVLDFEKELLDHDWKGVIV